MIKPLLTSLMLCSLVAGLAACKTQQPQPQSSNLPSSAPPSAGSSGSMPSTGSQGSSGPSATASSQPGASSGNPGTGTGTNSSTTGVPGQSSGSTQSSTYGEPAGSRPGGSGEAGSGQASSSPGDFSNGQSGRTGTAATGEGGMAQGNPGDGNTGQAGARSRNEQIAELEGELDNSMEDYDGMILRERNRAVARANERGSEDQLEDFDPSVAYYEEGDLTATNASGTAGGGDMAEAPANANGTPKAGDQPSGGGGGPVPGSGGRDAPYPPPKDIPDGSDDDIVARQIREAALYEKDPDVREKLWEEYRKYKEATE